MVHGSGAGAWEWALWREVFEAAGWRTRAVDLEPAPAGLAATRLEDYARQVQAALAEAGPGTVLVGASLGGLLALALGRDPGLAALVLVNAVPPAGTPGWPLQRVRFPEVVGWGNRTVADTLERLPDAGAEPLPGAPERWRDESGAVLRALWEGVRVERPAVPALVVVGDLDEDVPAAVGLTLARRVGADALRLHGVSHLGALLGRRARAAARLALTWLAEAADPGQ
jgi:pimeloyl-ACP methyl ester carboxylesterase